MLAYLFHGGTLSKESCTWYFDMSSKKKELLSSAMKRTSEWFTSYILLHILWICLSNETGPELFS